MKTLILLGALLAAPLCTLAQEGPGAPPPYPTPLNCPTQAFNSFLTMQYAHGTWYPNPGTPTTDITVVVAHRGLWEYSNTPENSVQAIAAAANGCVEAVEIDLRLTSDGQVVPMHDWNLQRTTNGKGVIYAVPFSYYSSLMLNDRHGNVTTISAPSFSNILNAAQSAVNLMFIFDCKESLDVVKGNPNVYPTSYDVLKAAWPQIVAINNQYPGFRDRIAFKVRFRELPADPAQIISDLNAVSPGSIPTSCAPANLSSCTVLNIIPIWYDNDNGVIPQSQITAYLALANTPTGTGEFNFPFLWYPEVAVPYLPNAPLQPYINGPGSTSPPQNGVNVNAFYPNNDWPEGASMGSGACCRIRNTANTYSSQANYGGDMNYFSYQGFNMVNSDKVYDVMSYLQAQGKRNVCRLAGNCSN
jgi:hypothetical protein